MAHSLTEPLRRRHIALRGQVETIGDVAGRIRNLDPSERRLAVSAVLGYLHGDLRLHAEAEELFLYPRLARRLRHPLGTAAMEFDHALLRGYAERLSSTDPREGLELERILYGIHALLDSHFRKEEEVYLPLLEYEDEAESVAALGEEMARHEAGLAPVRRLEELDLERKEFPFGGSELARLAFLLRYAVLAPSSHNTQPWRLQADGDALLLSADRARALPVVDPEDRELEISCGALLQHVRISIRHHGYADEVSLLPDPDDPDLLARIALGAERRPTYEERLLFWAMAKRHTSRQPFAPDPLPGELLSALVESAEAEGAWLQPLEDEAGRAEFARLVSEGDRIQMQDPSFRRELAAWVHGDRRHTADGMPVRSLGLRRIVASVAPLALRTFDLGKGVAAHDTKLVEASPVLAVLGTEGDSTADRLAAGQALARVLLRATQDGVSASFLNQPFEVAELRPRAAALVNRPGMPQLGLRFGYGPEAEPTPRRPIRDLFA